MTLSNGIVIEVVCWCHFDNTRTKIQINIFISNNGDLTVTQRKVDRLANQMLVAFVCWVDHDGNVTEQGFRASGGNCEMA